MIPHTPRSGTNKQLSKLSNTAAPSFPYGWRVYLYRTLAAAAPVHSWLWRACNNTDVRVRADIITLIIWMILMATLTRLRMIKEERLARPGDARPSCSWSAELHSSSWVWEVHWSCVIMYSLLSPERAHERMLSKTSDARPYTPAAPQVGSGNLLIFFGQEEIKTFDVKWSDDPNVGFHCTNKKSVFIFFQPLWHFHLEENCSSVLGNNKSCIQIKWLGIIRWRPF